MSLVLKPTRYAHPEGHTDVCYFTGEKGGLITCGTDGDVRAWVNLMDDDPSASCIAETATTVVAKKEKVYAGNDNNTVQILNHPQLDKEGIVTRFAATVCALATAKESSLIVSGGCDMRIQVSNVDTNENFELLGHEAPILGLSLDPRDEFLASSSGDGTIRIWSIKDKKSIYTWNNIVPKANSFFTAKAYGTPSFETKSGKYLAYPHGKEVIIVERGTWKESFRLKSTDIKNDISICRFSECGTFLAASTVYGEVIVWNFESKEPLGYVEHKTNAKITSMAWNPVEPNEIAYCDALGQLGCIDVNIANSEFFDIKPANGHVVKDDFMFDEDDDDDDDNVISLSKIKASVVNDDQKSISSITSENKYVEKRVLPEINLQEPFQPGSTPDHLISRYMMWNDVGIIMRFNSEDDDGDNIEVNFHDVTVHHSVHISNYVGHTMAALSAEALVLAAPRIDDKPSKLVVVALQVTGNKEWSVDLPDEEEVQAVAAGTTFVAVATNARTLRLFMPGGTQREVVSLPGPVVAMNALGNNLAIVYHSSIGAFGDQILNLMWIRICGPNLKSHTLRVPLSPKSHLMWVGFSDIGSPVVLDSEGIINMYDKKAILWRVACNTNRHKKGKFDHYFIIGVSESEGLMRCILCKGSHYPQTTPRPIVTEVTLTIPLCDPESKKSENEALIWRPGNNPVDESKAMLALIAEAILQDVEYRVLEICQQIAPQKVLELAVRYCGYHNRHILATKLEKIACSKESQETSQHVDTQEDIFNNIETVEDDELLLVPTNNKVPDIIIKPLMPSQPFGRRSNPWTKKGNTSTSKGLSGLDSIEKEPPRVVTPVTIHPTRKETKKDTPKQESFISWLSKNRKRLEDEHPAAESKELMKLAYNIFKEELQKKNNTNSNIEKLAAAPEVENKKRKLSDDECTEENQPKRSASSKLAVFARSE
ncbi:WD repeat and HMG-box DNA-binding protein 1 [Phymastichus coffea]|uniref:WD repeat and HMG-box DNA-binding protein 1 n=1 Tax=Phymastichus coffea TaxID=108790 RepID=UPI00273B31E0|nr:WD repeat and HMG-box DNA-binding protein 1 [Phymastichus coffea]